MILGAADPGRCQRLVLPQFGRLVPQGRQHLRVDQTHGRKSGTGEGVAQRVDVEGWQAGQA